MATFVSWGHFYPVVTPYREDSGDYALFQLQAKWTGGPRSNIQIHPLEIKNWETHPKLGSCAEMVWEGVLDVRPTQDIETKQLAWFRQAGQWGTVLIPRANSQRASPGTSPAFSQAQSVLQSVSCTQQLQSTTSTEPPTSFKLACLSCCPYSPRTLTKTGLYEYKEINNPHKLLNHKVGLWMQLPTPLPFFCAFPHRKGWLLLVTCTASYSPTPGHTRGSEGHRDPVTETILPGIRQDGKLQGWEELDPQLSGTGPLGLLLELL